MQPSQMEAPRLDLGGQRDFAVLRGPLWTVGGRSSVGSTSSQIKNQHDSPTSLLVLRVKVHWVFNWTIVIIGVIFVAQCPCGIDKEADTQEMLDEVPRTLGPLGGRAGPQVQPSSLLPQLGMVPSAPPVSPLTGSGWDHFLIFKAQQIQYLVLELFF